MNFTFKRDQNAAVRAEGTLSITETGDYIVTILEADTFSNTYDGVTYQIVRLLIESEKKERQTIELVVDGGDGDWNLRLFHSMLTCMHIDSVNFQPATVTPHRKGRLEENNINGYRSRELEKKRVGVVLQKSWRTYFDKKTNEEKDTYDMRVQRFFDPETNQTATEIVKSLPATRLVAFLKTLTDKGAPKFSADAQKPAQPSQAPASSDWADDGGAPF